MNTTEQVGQKLRASIRSAREQKWNLVVATLCASKMGKNYCCAVGSVAIDVPEGEPRLVTIAERLGIGVGDVISVAVGFDGSVPNLAFIEQQWYDLGVNLRNEVKAGIL